MAKLGDMVIPVTVALEGLRQPKLTPVGEHEFTIERCDVGE